MKVLTSKQVFFAGTGLIIAVNAVVLGGVAFNRSGEPDSILELTERELRVTDPSRDRKDNSGMSLALDWRTPIGQSDSVDLYWMYDKSPAWLDRKKLTALGFNVAALEHDEYSDKLRSRLFSKEVYIVLELNGPAAIRSKETMNRWATQARTASESNPGSEDFARKAKTLSENRAEEDSSASRLFAVDAGLNATTLRSTYPDGKKYAIVLGHVQPRFSERKNTGAAGHITKLSSESINVPLNFRHVFEARPELGVRRGRPIPAPVSTTIAYGLRHEPWIVVASKPN